MNYWKWREDLFGQDGFAPLRMSIFRPEDLETARNHGIFLLPGMDKARRSIIVSVKPRWKYDRSDHRTVLRWLWYLNEVALETEEAQKNGIVGFEFADGAFSLEKFDRRLDAKVSKMIQEALPVRWVGAHLCYDSRIFEFLVPIMLWMLGPKMRARIRIYPGASKSERLEQFEQMGISASILPTFMKGDYEVNVEAFMEERREKEATMDVSSSGTESSVTAP